MGKRKKKMVLSVSLRWRKELLLVLFVFCFTGGKSGSLRFVWMDEKVVLRVLFR